MNKTQRKKNKSEGAGKKKQPREKAVSQKRTRIPSGCQEWREGEGGRRGDTGEQVRKQKKKENRDRVVAGVWYG